MMVRNRRFLLGGVVVSLVLASWLVLALNCPSAGIAITAGTREFHRLKNRTSIPQAPYFDLRVTLDPLLQRGYDRDRWSTNRAGRDRDLMVDLAHACTEAV